MSEVKLEPSARAIINEAVQLFADVRGAFTDDTIKSIDKTVSALRSLVSSQTTRTEFKSAADTWPEGESCAHCGKVRADHDLRVFCAPQRDDLTRIRAAGYTVAVHNDYKQNGELFTFWLFTHPDGRYLKGEGQTDAEALAIIARQL